MQGPSYTAQTQQHIQAVCPTTPPRRSSRYSSITDSRAIDYSAGAGVQRDLLSSNSWYLVRATRGCRKLKMGAVDWNPELQTLRNRIHAWKLQFRKIKGCRVGSSCLNRVLLAAELTSEAVNLQMAEVDFAQKTNFKAYKLARKDHIASRDSWLLNLARSKSQLRWHIGSATCEIPYFD